MPMFYSKFDVLSVSYICLHIWVGTLLWNWVENARTLSKLRYLSRGTFHWTPKSSLYSLDVVWNVWYLYPLCLVIYVHYNCNINSQLNLTLGMLLVMLRGSFSLYTMTGQNCFRHFQGRYINSRKHTDQLIGE
jgi:hypothetical protein